MSGNFLESDWKVLRALQAPLLERFCRRVLQRVTTLAGDAGAGSAHERYLKMYALIHEEDEDLALAFNDQRRSNAFQKICALYTRKVFLEEEFRRFSVQTQEDVVRLCTVEGDPFVQQVE
jgi:hypothetical protein